MSARGITTSNRPHTALRRWAVRAVVGALVTTLGMIAPAPAALASWTSHGSGSATSDTGALAPPTDVTARSSGDLEVDIDWTASAGPVPVSYYVLRIGEAGTEAACGTGPGSLIDSLGCTDTLSAAGAYAYRVVAVHLSWTATSDASELVTFEDTFLGAAASFSLLGVTATNTGGSLVAGDLGVSPDGEVIDFSSEMVGGDIHLNDAASAVGASALVRAYGDAATRPSVPGSAGELTGMTFTPGVYASTGAVTFTGEVTLDALGDPNALFIFQINGALTASTGSSIVLTGGASPSNVYWQVDGATDLRANAAFSGTILAFGAITLDANTVLTGRALSQAAVTLDGAVIRFTDDGARLAIEWEGGRSAQSDEEPEVPAELGEPPALPDPSPTVTQEPQR